MSSTINNTKQHDAFISYSHDDFKLAKRLRRRITSYRAPKSTGLDKRKLDVFLDEEQYNLGGSLPENLASDVQNSKHLILLATPSSAASPWVEQEASIFISTRGKDSVLPVACKGDENTSFPPSLAAINPLYLDMRDIPFWHVFKFNRESLRIIAELLDVEYRVLRREDQLRARRRGFLLISTLLIIAIGVFTSFVAKDVREFSWIPITQPPHSLDDPIEPVEEVAISFTDDSYILYLGINSTYVRVSENAEGRFDHFGKHPDVDRLFRDAIKENNKLKDTFVHLGTQNIDISSWNENTINGSMRLYGYYDSQSDKIEYYKDARFKAKNDEGNTKEAILLPTKSSPWELSPWPRDPLLELGINIEETFMMKCKGLLWPEPKSIEFVWFDADEGVAEANEIKVEKIIFFNQLDSEIDPSSDDAFLHDIADDDSWEYIQESEDWHTYVKPRQILIELSSLDYDSNGSVDQLTEEGLKSLSMQLVGYSGLDKAIVGHLKLGEVSNEIEIISRGSSDSNLVQLATIRSAFWEFDSEEVLEPLHFLRLKAESSWINIQLQTRSAETRVTDIVILDHQPEQIIIATDRDGLFMSDDGGINWFDGNFGQTQLLGRPLSVIVTKSRPFVLATGANIGGINPLFRFERRNWMQRALNGTVNMLKK